MRNSGLLLPHIFLCKSWTSGFTAHQLNLSAGVEFPKIQQREDSPKNTECKQGLL